MDFPGKGRATCEDLGCKLGVQEARLHVDLSDNLRSLKRKCQVCSVFRISLDNFALPGV